MCACALCVHLHAIVLVQTSLDDAQRREKELQRTTEKEVQVLHSFVLYLYISLNQTNQTKMTFQN